jgi:cytochrome c oxidase subunit 2
MAAGLLVTSCADSPSAIDTSGPAASEIAGLWWLMLALGTIVFILVFAALGFAIFRSRRQPEDSQLAADAGTPLVIWGGIIIPAVILIFLFGATIWTMSSLAAPDSDDHLRIEVTGYQFWWDIRYPDQNVRTANELHIPVGEPVQIILRSNDVIHSFWVPQLHGKMDLVPGKTNNIWIEADEPGTYRGQCAEFCGVQHANMAFHVVAGDPSDFQAWIEGQQQPAEQLTDSILLRGQQVFLGSGCTYCHTIDGTSASSEVGPDLTHLASRQYIAAGVLPNNQGSLGGWILDPQGVKPGNLMPPTRFEPNDLQALLAYLESLK